MSSLETLLNDHKCRIRNFFFLQKEKNEYAKLENKHRIYNSEFLNKFIG